MHLGWLFLKTHLFNLLWLTKYHPVFYSIRSGEGGGGGREGGKEVWSSTTQEVWVSELTVCFETGYEE